MHKSQKLFIIFALVAVIALPLLFREKQGTAQEGEDTLVLISPHPENNQAEFKRAFADWYQRKTGRTVKIDWRYPGGLSEIIKIVNALFDNAFRAYWEGSLRQNWSLAIEQHYSRISKSSEDPSIKAAQQAFLDSPVGCGIDILFGGGGQEFELLKHKHLFLVPKVVEKYPEWFSDDIFPLQEGGFRMRDTENKWFGVVFSSYGIAYNEDVLTSLSQPIPNSWDDLGSPAYLGELALGDPAKSGSVKQSFEMVLQSCMQKVYSNLKKIGTPEEKAETLATEEGWLNGLSLIQKMAANTRYFTEKSNRPIMSVAAGNCAASMALDFTALCQEDNMAARHSEAKFGFIVPEGGSAYAPDCVAMFRGAPNPSVAELFIEFILGMEGQKIWAYKAGTPGGPSYYSLRRLPIRKDFYQEPSHLLYRSDPERNPYQAMEQFQYRANWTEPTLPILHKIIRAAFIDPQEELRKAWAAIQIARREGRIEDADNALAMLENFAGLDYQTAVGPLKKELTTHDPMVEAIAINRITERFLKQYRHAEALANANSSIAEFFSHF